MNRVLVFVLYKKEATRIEEVLQRQGWKVTSVQGDKTQVARQKAVDDFKGSFFSKINFNSKIIKYQIMQLKMHSWGFSVRCD